MAKISLQGFKDPVRRPRYIIWTGVVAIVLIAVVIVALGASSTRWFCSEACHKVQDDSIIAYKRSSHSNISCMACHMPVNADPVTFVLHKMTALGELYLTVRNDFELPLNADSHVALSSAMPAEICTQCHSENRKVTPSEGIIIDHEIHAEKEVKCTLCHNRVGHREDFELTLKHPVTKEPNRKHYDFMEMTACFRCHSLEKGAKAPGRCSACHPKDFELKPPSHFEKAFYPKGHAELAKEDVEKVEKAKAAYGKEGKEGKEGDAGKEGEKKSGLDAAHAGGGKIEGPWAEIPPVGEVSYCSTCHVKDKFCLNCHGMEMPHSAAFKEPTKPGAEDGHPAISKKKADKCELCHQVKKTKFCDDCHHGKKVDWKFVKTEPWERQHAKTVVNKGVDGCLKQCHQQKFCLDCHTKKQPFPTSHKSRTWLHGPKLTVTAFGSTKAVATAEHALGAVRSNYTACNICHGEGGTKSKFCSSCHKLAMPHPDEFKKFHAKTGRTTPKVCSNCHRFKELCSDCHHKGASNKTSWQKAHPKTVASDGTGGCFEKCHKKDFCVKCHVGKKIVPTSHEAKGWTKRAKASVKALHPAAYNKQVDSCSYCHGGGTPDKNKFCMSCHKLPMPHATDYKDTHKPQFQEKKLKKATCSTCHNNAVFCNNCHHQPDFKTGPKTWIFQHPDIVKKKGAEGCFEKCHKETYCSYCHVNLAAQFRR